MDANEVVKSLAALAQPVRLQVFRALVVSGKAGLTPGTRPTRCRSISRNSRTPAW
jgi:hypothetical protein